MSVDKRSSNRVPLNTKVHLEFEKFSGFVSEFSHNISPGGMFIKTPNPLPIGSIVSFEFRLKDSFQLIQGLGEVSWIRSNVISADEPAGMGIRFREISDRSRDLIKAIVTQTKSQGDRPFDIDDQPDAVTSTISAHEAKEVYGSEPLKDALNSVPSSSDTTQAQPNDTHAAIDNLDAHLIDNTVSNPSLNDENDAFQATHTEIFDPSRRQNSNFDDVDDPLTSPDEHTFASMEDDPILSEGGSGLSDSFELSLDEEMNDPDFDSAGIVDNDQKSNPKPSSLGVKIFLSLIFISLLAGAYLLKDLYLPILKDIPFIAQYLDLPEDITPPTVVQPDPVEEKIQALTQNETPVEQVTADNTDDKTTEPDVEEITTAEASNPAKKQSDVANNLQEDQARSKDNIASNSQTKTPVAEKQSSKPEPPITSETTAQLETDPSLLRVKNLTWTVDKDDWVLVIETDKTMDRNNLVHNSLRNGPARELIILKGMQKDFSNRTIPVEQTGVYRIRTGYHQSKTPAELHVVIDILNSDIKMKKIQVLGSIVKVFFGAPVEQ
ncbi:MAG TPA: TIGR02266 family protein [Oligoflexia bacterium]|nr:TIGR02266 family protein [Oligoflexia bacterium]HMR25548.1 TIGR02266 family protein [Oligoflexia bacterium]